MSQPPQHWYHWRTTPLLSTVRFKGAELEAAVALFSVLKTEGNIGRAKAAIALRDKNGRKKGDNDADVTAALRARLPLPAVVAAARSLRMIGAHAVRAIDALEGQPAGVAAVGGGGAGAGGRVGQPSAVRLARYLTRQGDM